MIDLLQRSSAARIINVSSAVHRLGASVFDINDLQLTDGYSPMKAYGLSKLCNIMFTYELAKKIREMSITANCLHPEVVGTRLADEASWVMKLFYFIGNPFMRSSTGGAQTSIYLAISDKVGNISGKYFKNKKVNTPSSIAFEDKFTEALWEKSAHLTNLE